MNEILQRIFLYSLQPPKTLKNLLLFNHYIRSGRVPNLQYASDWEPFIERGYEVLEEARRFQNYFVSSIGNSDEEFVPESLRERNIQTSIEYEAVSLKFFSDIWRLKESYRDNLSKGLLSEEGLEEY